MGVVLTIFNKWFITRPCNPQKPKQSDSDRIMIAPLIDTIQRTDAPPTETVDHCPFCDSAESRFLFWNFDRLNHLPGKFGIIQCQKCELVRLSPRPLKSELPFYYPETDYYSFQAPTVSVHNISQREFACRVREKIRQVVFYGLGYPVGPLSAWQRILKPFLMKFFFKPATYGWGRRFPRYKPDGLALDVGCGNGSYLSFLKYYGWKVVGLDLNKQASEVAGKDLGIEVHVAELEDADFPPNTFDYINMSHVLEHVPAPVNTLKKVREILKPNGIVYIEVPNYGSLSRKISGKYWYAWETPRHLYMFSPDTLARIVRSCGLTIIKLETRVENLFAWDATYRHEESLGKKLSPRPFTTRLDKMRIFFASNAAKLSLALNRKSGDFVCCWARKEA